MNNLTRNIVKNKSCMYYIFLSILILFTGCAKEDQDSIIPDNMKYHEFESFSDFKNTLENLSEISDDTERQVKLQSFWDSLKSNHQVPFIFNDSVAFLYQGNASSVFWAGDFNGWSSSPTYQGTKVGLSNIWMLEKKFPTDARLDYKIIANGSWILDLANSYTQLSGFGNNSELRMPDWIFPQETILAAGVTRGTLSNNLLIHSSLLNYDLQYKVYTPYGYDGLSNLPVIYVTDGHEYARDLMGSMVIVLDNLIFSNKINPVIAVFIDPRQPDNLGINKRMAQYTGNIQFANFVADELVLLIDQQYKTNTNANARAILGTSLGGWNSAYFGLSRSDKFGLIGIHSPAFDNLIIQSYSNSPKLPLKIFMSTGVIFDTQDRARTMKVVFDTKGYPLLYKEVNEGHSWGNWRALMDEPLIYFFGK
ncbi:MAG: alpha/beta hydrolase-fold protein [Tenuifilaceae bacterium]